MGKTASKKMQKKKATIRFEAVKIDPLFEVLDAVAFLDSPDTRAIAQFADIDPRTAGKIPRTRGLSVLSNLLKTAHTSCRNRTPSRARKRRRSASCGAQARTRRVHITQYKGQTICPETRGGPSLEWRESLAGRTANSSRRFHSRKDRSGTRRIRLLPAGGEQKLS